MNVLSIDAVFRTVLAVLAGLMFVLTLVLALAGFCKWSHVRLKAAVRKCGPFAVGFFLGWGALIADSQNMTQDEKDDLIEQEEEDDEENAVLGGLLLGSPRLMGFRGGLCGFGSGGPEPAAAEEPVEIWGLAAEDTPSVRAPTDSDYAAGLALTGIGTGEAFDFTPPDGATVYEPWMRFGAARHWFRLGNSEEEFSFPLGTNVVDALTVFSDGLLRLKTKDVGTFLAPLHADLCLAPAYWWERLENSFASPSRFWSAQTSVGGHLFTWENALFDRDPSKPVSFQVEIAADGSVDFRYDLSRLDAADLTNLVVGAGFERFGRVFTELQSGTTSLKWRRLDPMRAGESDPDGDGITTADEIVLYQTDPYSADTDRDGISDYDEINVSHSDPTDPHSVNPAYPDGFAVILGDADPFSCPVGSTNTVLEHVFYTGTTNAPFAYLVSSGSTAVLDVTVSGSGSGRLVIGDTVVPLVPRPRPRLLMGAADASDPTANTLHIPVEKGTIRHCTLYVPESLEVAISSADFVYGERPTLWRPRGWLAFPNTEASHPCIHDLNARQVAVSLDPGFAAEGLTCTWHPTESVDVRRTGDLSAELKGDFPPNTTTPITYTLSHPQYICGETDYSQTVRFCPQIDDDDLPEGDGCRVDDEQDPEEWCDCGNCEIPWCPCSCHDRDLIPLDDDCPVHGCPWESCEYLHHAAYEASNTFPPHPDVLKLGRNPPDTDEIEIDVPEGLTYCCPCPEHWTNKVSLAYKSYNLAVRDEAGERFTEATRDCSVFVSGLSPSRAIGDSTLMLCKTGVVYEAHDYTVLGMRIESYGVDVDALRRANSDFGLPFIVGTQGKDLTLKADVLLPEGNVRLAIANATTRMRLVFDVYGYEELLLDSETCPELCMPISVWRKMTWDRFGETRYSSVRIYADAPGHADLEFGFATSADGRSIPDSDTLRVTAVNPPLLPDYDRDGKIDARDATNWMNGAVFRYWTNQDAENGDCIDETEYDVQNASDLEVNGRLDLVNLFPLALNLQPFVDAWGNDASFELWTYESAEPLHVCFVDVPWSEAGSIQTNDVRVADNARVAYADLEPVPYDGYLLPYGTIRGFSEDSGLLIAEAASPVNDSIYLTIRLGDETVMQHRINTRIRPVREMYRFYSLRGAEANGDNTFEPPANPGALTHPDEKDQDIFFTHGFNVSEADSHKWGDVLFKRFWLSGSNARFNMVTWRGNYHWTGDWSWANALHYQHDVWFAQRTAGALKRLLEREQPDSSKRILMTQSLGNMVACEALRQGLHVGKYFMFDAAVATEAIDATLQNVSDDIRTKYVPSKWRDYDPLSWSANWFRWFVGDPDDARGRIGWAGRFTEALGNATEVYNYYSSGDHVFKEAGRPPRLSEGMLDYSGEIYCWQKQETKKGLVTLAGTRFGGWGFYTYNFPVWSDEDNRWNTVLTNYTPAQASAMVADGSITNNPVFNRGFEPMFDHDMSQDDQWLALAKYVPAVSHPVGGNAIPSFARNNYDMNGLEYRDGWGRDNGSRYSLEWQHSDMKDMAYFYVHKLYEELVSPTRGDLK